MDHQNLEGPIEVEDETSLVLNKLNLKVQTEPTVNNEFKPHTTSFKRRVGAQPSPSMEFWRNSDRQMSPVTEMFGCHSFVAHFTFGGYKNK